ncbi:MAG TPA: lysophospholipid acyltransferase family protein [Verrucomicrobiae bacterium]|nr:lysophospholipid acyltransferase family protein [Verrucomicrobiae bacterium]
MIKPIRMRILLKPFQILYVLYAFALFIVFMIPVFLWALLVSNLGRNRGGNLLYGAIQLWADVWFPLIFILHRNIYEEPLKKHQSYIYVSNHISYLDSALIPKVWRKPVRPLGKVEMTRIPIFGTIYKNAIVTVDRSSTANRARSVQVLKSLLKKEISVLVFPEGTFNESSKPLKHFYDGAFKVAIETGTPLKPVLLLDAYDRMHYGSPFSLNPGRSRAVFLKEVSTDGLTVQDTAALKQKVYDLMEKKLIEYNASWIKSLHHPHATKNK